MANRSSLNCECRKKPEVAMTTGQLGLDELMIVNPSPPATDALFLGEDGTVYQVQGLGEEAQAPGTGEFFLGADGTLYQMQGLGLNGAVEGFSPGNVGERQARELGRYLLGGDGRLYEAIV
jgi:hypothetical protein